MCTSILQDSETVMKLQRELTEEKNISNKIMMQARKDSDQLNS